MRRSGFVTGILPLACLLTLPPLARGAEVRVAVAANFAPTLAELSRTVLAPAGIEVRVSVGSTGQLYAQIIQGAPFDVFLAADTERPKKLDEAGRVAPGSRWTYARGVLVLYRKALGGIADGEALLRAGGFAHLAIANPRTAPYGRAAQELLEHWGLWQALAPRIVRGESVAQAMQFVAGGQAEIGLVALSQVLRFSPELAGSVWRVPLSLYAPIEQQGVVLRGATNEAAALRLVALLQSEAARAVVRRDGYLEADASDADER